MAEHYSQDTAVQRKFLRMDFLDMCGAAGEYKQDHRYFDALRSDGPVTHQVRYWLQLRHHPPQL